MIIVRFFGGLGNQMFQYALYCALVEKGKDVRADYTWYESRDLIRMPDFFTTNIRYASIEDIERVGDYNRSLLAKARRRLIGTKKSHYYEPKYGHYDSKIFDMDDIYIDGYWQSERYFEKCKQTVRDSFCLKSSLDEANMSMLRQIQSSNSVSVHFRLGDYMPEDNTGLYGDICTKAYYCSAIDYFQKRIPNPTFFIFSNEPQKVLEQFDGVKCVIVDINDEKQGYKDMYLMSQCKHNIIANSSFSWWAAWLNKNEEKEIVAPDIWFSTEDVKDIWPQGWKKVDQNGIFL